MGQFVGQFGQFRGNFWDNMGDNLRVNLGDNFGTKRFLFLFFPVETNALQCYHCGTDPAVQKPILLGALTRDPSYDYDAYEVPTCNYFNTSLSEYVITCQPDEKGCLKGWVTQVG